MQQGFSRKGIGFKGGFVDNKGGAILIIGFFRDDDVASVSITSLDGFLDGFFRLRNGDTARIVGALDFDFLDFLGGSIDFDFIAFQGVRIQEFQLEFIVISLGTDKFGRCRNDFLGVCYSRLYGCNRSRNASLKGGDGDSKGNGKNSRNRR